MLAGRMSRISVFMPYRYRGCAKIPRRAKDTRERSSSMRFSMDWRISCGMKKKRLTKEKRDTKKALIIAYNRHMHSEGHLLTDG